MSFRFDRGLKLGDRVFVTARTLKIGTTSCVQTYGVWHGNLVGQGEAVCVFIDPASGAKTPLNHEFRLRIAQIDPDVEFGKLTRGMERSSALPNVCDTAQPSLSDP